MRTDTNTNPTNFNFWSEFRRTLYFYTKLLVGTTVFATIFLFLYSGIASGKIPFEVVSAVTAAISTLVIAISLKPFWNHVIEPIASLVAARMASDLEQAEKVSDAIEDILSFEEDLLHLREALESYRQTIDKQFSPVIDDLHINDEFIRRFNEELAKVHRAKLELVSDWVEPSDLLVAVIKSYISGITSMPDEHERRMRRHFESV